MMSRMETWVLEEPEWHRMQQRLLSRFQQNGILCDTTLACANGEAVKAHSCVLAAASERVRSLLSGVQSGDYTLQMNSITSTTWRYLLRFIYDGRVTLPTDQISRVKDAAIRFEIVPLINMIQNVEMLQRQGTGGDACNATRQATVRKQTSEVIVLDDDDDDDTAGTATSTPCTSANCSATSSVGVTAGDNSEDIQVSQLVCPVQSHQIMSSAILTDQLNANSTAEVSSQGSISTLAVAEVERQPEPPSFSSIQIIPEGCFDEASAANGTLAGSSLNCHNAVSCLEVGSVVRPETTVAENSSYAVFSSLSAPSQHLLSLSQQSGNSNIFNQFNIAPCPSIPADSGGSCVKDNSEIGLETASTNSTVSDFELDMPVLQRIKTTLDQAESYNFDANVSNNSGADGVEPMLCISNVVSLSEQSRPAESALNPELSYSCFNAVNVSPVLIPQLESLDDQDQTSESTETVLPNRLVPTSVLPSRVPIQLKVPQFTVSTDFKGPSSTAVVAEGSVNLSFSFTSTEPSDEIQQCNTLPQHGLTGPTPIMLFKHTGRNNLKHLPEGVQKPQRKLLKSDNTLQSACKRSRKTLEQTTQPSSSLASIQQSNPLPSDDPKHDAVEYSWPGETGRFNGCSKLVDRRDSSFGAGDPPTPRTNSQHRKQTLVFKPDDAVLERDSLDEERFSGVNAATDHNYFMQPDNATKRTMPSKMSVYNFTETEGELDTLSGVGHNMPLKIRQKTIKTLEKQSDGQQIGNAPPCAKLKPSNNVQGQKQRGRRKLPSPDPCLSTSNVPSVQFVGKRIRHEWVMSTNPRTTQWYTGEVLRLVKGKDGEPGSKYEVRYEGDDIYLIDHLLDDYLDNSLIIL